MSLLRSRVPPPSSCGTATGKLTALAGAANRFSRFTVAAAACRCGVHYAGPSAVLESGEDDRERAGLQVLVPSTVQGALAHAGEQRHHLG